MQKKFSKIVVAVFMMFSSLCANQDYLQSEITSAGKVNHWGALQPQIKDSVVQIFSHHVEFNWLQPYQTPVQKASAGSGFFIDAEGHIVTNEHVVSQSKSLAIQVPSLGKEKFEVDVIGVCPDRDIALLKLKDDELKRIKDALGKIKFLKLGDSSKILQPEKIMLMGYPLGQQGLKRTVGVVSGFQNIDGHQYIQIDAAANPGNSGGPALNKNGEVLGVLSRGFPEAQNASYIIPVNELKVVINDLYNTPSKLVRRPFLGICYCSASRNLVSYFGNPMPGGVYVTDVSKGSVLDVAGVEPGDMIYEINGYKVDLHGDIRMSYSDSKISLSEYSSFLEIGTKVNMIVYRRGELKSFDFNFRQTKLPAIRRMYPEYEKIDYEIVGGFVIMELTRDHIKIMNGAVDDVVKYKNIHSQDEHALVITHILPASQAQKSCLFEAGGFLKEVNEKKVGTLAELREALYESVDSEYLTIKTSNNVFAAFSFKKILQDEAQLSAIFHYPISKTMQDLYQKAIQNKKLSTVVDA